MARRTQLIFVKKDFLRSILHVSQEHLGISKIRVLLSGTFPKIRNSKISSRHVTYCTAVKVGLSHSNRLLLLLLLLLLQYVTYFRF